MGDRSPAIFCAPQNITKHAVSVILALYFLRSRPESNPAVVLLVSVKNSSLCDRCALLFFCTKILSEDPYLKSFIRRVLCWYRERFSSISRYATRSRRVPYYLPVLHRTVRTKAVKSDKWDNLLSFLPYIGNRLYCCFIS